MRPAISEIIPALRLEAVDYSQDVQPFGVRPPLLLELRPQESRPYAQSYGLY